MGYETEGLRARIGDFGLAKTVNPLTLLATSAGTPAFKPPEAFSENNGDSCAADVWAIGTTLYLLLTDRLPFRLAKDWGWNKKNLVKERVRPASDINPNVNVSLDSIISKTLNFRAERRFQNASELLDALDSWKPGFEAINKAVDVKESQTPKTALNVEHSSPDRSEAEKMAQKAIELKTLGELGQAADVMEEAFNKWPELRGKYAGHVKLWRCGISM